MLDPRDTSIDDPATEFDCPVVIDTERASNAFPVVKLVPPVLLDVPDIMLPESKVTSPVSNDEDVDKWIEPLSTGPAPLETIKSPPDCVSLLVTPALIEILPPFMPISPDSALLLEDIIFTEPECWPVTLLVFISTSPLVL